MKVMLRLLTYMVKTGLEIPPPLTIGPPAGSDLEAQQQDVSLQHLIRNLSMLRYNGVAGWVVSNALTDAWSLAVGTWGWLPAEWFDLVRGDT